MISELTLSQRIAMLEASQKGEMVPAQQVWELVEAVKEVFGQREHTAHTTSELYKELGDLAKFINAVKKELQEVKEKELGHQELPTATNHLDAIVQMTEEATSRIMDECDKLSTFHNDVRERLINMDPPLDPNVLAGVDDGLNEAMTSITHIYEACNFQDITVQRIQKVVKALQEVERQVLRMVVVFGLVEHQDKLDDATKAELTEDAALLNGPQMQGQGLAQDDIDDILSKLL